MASGGDVQRWRDSVVLQWSALLALVIGLPWFRGGYLLTYDMAWVPEPALDRADVWGLGSALPRAVPSDAVVALLGSVVDPMVVQRVVLLGALVLAGTGAARLVASLPLPARVAAATLAIVNPFVAERLVLGQWPVLVAYAALFWLAAEVLANQWRWSVVILALAGTALSPATGLMGLAAVLVLGWGSGAVRLGLVAVLLNAPWVAAGVLRSDALDPDTGAVRLFSLQPEGVLGHLGTALSLGGIWNADVVPTSRTLTAIVVAVGLTWLIALVGLAALARSDRRALIRLAVLGVLGLAVACAGWLVPDLLEDGIEAFGPLALLRDGTRWLALLAPLYVASFAHGAAVLAGAVDSRAWRAAPVFLAVVLPLAALPDIANGVSGRVTPVDYPASWDQARSEVAGSDAVGDLAVLPFTAYRAPEWNEGRPVLDPAGRYFDRVTVTDDRLVVSGETIAGEDPRARQVRSALRSDDVPGRLADLDIGLVLVDTSAPAATRALRQVEDLDELNLGEGDLRLFEVDGARQREVDDRDRLVMIAAWGVAGLLLAVGLLGTAGRLVRRLRATVGGRGRAGGAANRRASTSP